ncbi:phage major capsid protein [Patulibacter defluvii]|uniref:phage major capsid protein n=1 Tax=Patulibacter defluvii TaxID=3095358 RepID=UPI002A75F06D|nr:phage major capsid protein [Patulibacter sp. DM4]
MSSTLSTTRTSDLLEERARLHGELKDQVRAAEEAGEGFSAEDLASYNQRGERLDRLDAEISARNRVAKLDEQARNDAADAAKLTREQAKAEDETLRAALNTDEYRDALTAFACGRELDDEQRSTLNVGTDGEGGYAVPEEWGSLREPLQQAAKLRGLSEVLTTATGGDLHIPFVSADAAEPGIVAEQTTIPDDAEEFDEVILRAYKVPQIVKGSEEMVQDALFDVPAFVGRRLGFRLGIKADKLYTIGTGTNQPQGIFVGSAVGVAAAPAVGYDQLIDLYHSVAEQYRDGAVFMMHDLTVAALRKIKDTTGRPLWEPSVQAGEPPRIIGVPTITSQFAPQMGAGSRSVLFGNPALGFTIRDVLGVTIKYLDQRYADNDQLAWRGKLRTDSKVTDQNALKVLVQA